MFFLQFLLYDRRIRIRIHISLLMDPDADPGDPKHIDPTDPDPQHCFEDWCKCAYSKYGTDTVPVISKKNLFVLAS